MILNSCSSEGADEEGDSLRNRNAQLAISCILISLANTHLSMVVPMMVKLLITGSISSFASMAFRSA